MQHSSIGFIGGGRVVRILLGGWKRAGAFPERCVVSDPDPEVLDALREEHPEVIAAGADNDMPSSERIVFGALHPPVLGKVLPDIGRRLREDAIFVSLAPVLRLARLREALGGFGRLARMIPNAASLIGVGFNPVSLSPNLGDDRAPLLDWLGRLGSCPEVDDELLEAYAILTAMGPTYFWYQFEELRGLATRFGLDGSSADRALSAMLHGAVDTFFESGLDPARVIDLIPVKPLEDSETALREAYRSRLAGLYEKLGGTTVAGPRG